MGCIHVWENFQWDKVAEQYIQYIYNVSGVQRQNEMSA